MKALYEKERSITIRIRRHISFIFVGIICLMTSSFLFSNYLHLSDYEERQTQTWIQSFPKSVVTHMVQFNYQPINSKLEYIKDTGLFRVFVVANKRNKPVAGFGFELSERLPENRGEINDRFGNTLGYFYYEQNHELVRGLIKSLLFVNAFIIVFGLVLFDRLFKKFLKPEFLKFDKYVNSLDEIVEKLNLEKDVSEFEYNNEDMADLSKSNRLKKTITKLVKTVNRILDEKYASKVELEKANTKQEIAMQVAHDIRSPLEALKSISGLLDDVDIQTRRIALKSIERISAIANGLLDSNRSSVSTGEITNVACVLEDICREKREERGAKIIFGSSLSLDDSYVVGQEHELSRVFSNLINNSLDASPAEKAVSLRLSLVNERVTIEIVDSGCGMDAETMQKALKGGFSTKNTGNGIGLRASREKVLTIGGDFSINSEVGKGTSVKISIPQFNSNGVFVSNLLVSRENGLVHCMDDDPSFLEAYGQKLFSIADRVIFHSSGFSSMENLDPEAIYFVDFELEDGFTGLDLIKKNKLGNAVLVTSRFYEKDVMRQARELGVKILPKQIFSKAKLKTTSESNATYVLIDDDALIRLAWERAAGERGKTLLAFESVSEFLLNSNDIKKDCRVFIDSNLGNNEKGEVESEKIFSRGFENLHLATGYNVEDLDVPFWIKSVVGKAPSGALNLH